MLASKRIKTASLETHYLECGDTTKDIVVLLHGNVSSCMFFRPMMESFQEPYHFLAPDMRGYGDSETLPVNATHGIRDFSEDLFHFLEAVNPQKKPVHLLGWSLGAGVILQCVMDHPLTVRSLTLLSPMSPFGFGGSVNNDAVLKSSDPDFAGCGGGAVNPGFLDCLRTRDGELASSQPEGLRCTPQTHARATMNGLYFKMIDGKTLRERGVVDQETEDLYTAAMFKTKLGEANYPGNSSVTAHWPGMAPGDKGVNNAISAKYCNLSNFGHSGLKLPILWMRGADDAIVSDTSFLDMNMLGKMNLVPGWPGAATHPPQPMVSQMRAVLDEYKQQGGSYTEAVFEDCGHSPHIEQPAKFKKIFFDFLRS